MKKCLETLEAETCDDKLKNETEKHMQTPVDPTDDVHVQNEAENHMETPLDTTDIVQVQTEAENCMETLLELTDDVQVQNEAENHRETTRSSRKGWHWNRIYPRGEFTPQQIRYTGEEKILKQLCRTPTVEDFFRLYITEEIIDHVVTQTNLYARQYLEAEKDNLRPHSAAY